MLAKRIIPCLDVKDGRVVKGVNFVDLVDAGDPVEQAQVYDSEGADELVFLDITATHEARDIVIDMVRRVADTVFIPFTVGGGLRTVDDMRAMLLAGADKVSINSAAVHNPQLIARGRPALAASASSSPSTPDAGRARTWRHAARAGTSSSAAGASTPSSTPSNGPRRSSGAAPARFCSRPWTATAPRRATMSSLTRAISDAVNIPGHRQRRRRPARPLHPGPDRRRGGRGPGRQPLPFQTTEHHAGQRASACRRRGCAHSG